MTEDLIEISNLDIEYKKSLIVEQINTTVEKAKFTALIGINGSGKSSLLRILAGLQKYKTGEILISGKKIQDYRPREFAKQLSFVSTELVSAPYMTVQEFLLLQRYAHKTSSSEEQDLFEVDNALQIVDIEMFRLRKLNELSDGERRKVMIAGAIAQNTPVIILDEPAAFLDMHAEDALYKLLRKLVDETGKTVLVSTHNVNEIMQIADKIWIIQNNNLSTYSPKIIKEQDLLRGFFGKSGLSFDQKQERFLII